MSTKNSKTAVFPFDLEMTSTLGVHKAKAFKLNPMGMIVQVADASFKPQLSLQLKWVMPLTNIGMQAAAVVVKTYNQMQAKKIIYFMEIHFKKLDMNQKDAVQNFIDKYEQTLKKSSDKAKALGDEES